jgi:conflict system pore-forming effector with SLATT domain/uncharacterized protein DUF4231
MTANTSQAVTDAWRDQREWSHAASRLKKRIVFWRSAALGFAVSGAVLTTLATQVSLTSSLGRVVSGIAALALAVVPVIRVSKLGKDRIEGWNRARSVSEAVKAEIYLYLTRTPPYDREDRDDELLRQTDGIIGQVDDLAGATIGRPDTDIPPPDVHDVASYVQWRVQPQIDDYYRPQAGKQKKRLSLFRGVEFTLSVLAAVLGAIAATAHSNRIGVWVAVVTTVGAAITAHIAAARYEHLVISYLSTARQLRSLLRRWEGRSDKNPTAAGMLVRECEDVISRENESWMAAWSHEEESAPHFPARP